MVIALLTDFGTTDYYVGAVKGTILSIDPSAVIVDISHEIAAHDIRAASFVLGACCEDFPADTIFIGVVDPGVGSARRAIAVAARGRKFVAPDNGLLTDALRDVDYTAVEITNRRYFGPRESSTFHGRDIFGPVAAYLSLGVPLAELGPAASELALIEKPNALTVGGSVHGQIVHIDRFGNLVTDLSLADIPPKFLLDVSGVTVRAICSAYAEMPRGELFLINGSSGRIEISLREASAAEFTGAAVGQKFVIHPVA